MTTIRTITMSSVLESGMTIRLATDTNRIRCRIGRKVDGSTYEVLTFIRPSRGFARHNRKLKRIKRKCQT
jgi:hypothetical protein